MQHALEQQNKGYIPINSGTYSIANGGNTSENGSSQGHIDSVDKSPDGNSAMYEITPNKNNSIYN